MILLAGRCIYISERNRGDCGIEMGRVIGPGVWMDTKVDVVSVDL